jgi:predicted PurR-regulated permease PerM
MIQPKILLRWATLLAATAIALYLCWQILRPFAGVIAWSVILVITFYPLHRRLVRSTGRPSLSALISAVFVALIILIPVVILTGLAVREFLDLKEALQAKFKDGLDPNDIPLVRQVMDWLGRYLSLDTTKIAESIRQHSSELAQMAARFSLAFAGNLSSLVVSFVFTIFSMFFLFRNGRQIVSKIPDLLPLERSQSEGLILRIRDVINGSIYGVLVIALIQGGLGGVIFGILAVPSPVLWGLVMSVASMIPLLGAASVWAPGAIYLLVTGNWMKAVILAAFGGIVISSVDNFLRPKLVGERVRLDELVMFFSVLGGLKLFGVLGIIAGPVVFAVAGSLLTTLRDAEIETKSPLPSHTRARLPD